MPFHQHGEVEFFQFEGLGDRSIVQAIFTRTGGVSPAPWRSLNAGGTVGDEPARVSENLNRMMAAIGRQRHSIYDVWQVHSANIAIATRPRDAADPLIQADGILTDNPDVTLFMRFADCVPILLHEPARGLVGLVHAGWRGTVKNVAGAAIHAMVQNFGAEARSIRAGIGPSIGPEHYPVGPEVVDQVMAVFGSDGDRLLLQNGPSVCLDLWQANRWLLERAGVEQVEIAGLCTSCEPQRWFSHRGERGRTGRFGAMIGLSPSGS